jgi:hypothetical protein
MKSRRIYVGHVACMGEKKNEWRIWWERYKERNHYESLDLCGRIILKWILDMMGLYGLD